MNGQDSTEPIQLDGQTGLFQRAWQSDPMTWSFGPSIPQLVSALTTPPEAPDHAAPNTNGATSTTGPQEIEVPDRRPKRIPIAVLGKRNFAPLYQWEGVVQEVFEDGFSARLVPFEHGAPNRGKTEFTDFDFDDLSDASDVDLVAPGAIFYWTLGRSMNEAGTQTKMSLVRFRRLPSPTEYQRRRAREEAERLLRRFGEVPSS